MASASKSPCGGRLLAFGRTIDRPMVADAHQAAVDRRRRLLPRRFQPDPDGVGDLPAAGEAGAGTGMTQSGPNNSFGVSRQKVRDASPRAMSVLVIVVADFRGILPRGPEFRTEARGARA